MKGEPFDLTLAVYETVQQRDPAGRDRGTARQRRAVLELVREAGSLDRLRVTAADVPESDRDRPLVEVLRELWSVLASWPSERSNRLASTPTDPEPRGRLDRVSSVVPYPFKLARVRNDSSVD